MYTGWKMHLIQTDDSNVVHCDTQCSENVPCFSFLTPDTLLCPVFPVILDATTGCLVFPVRTFRNLLEYRPWAEFFKKFFSFIPANSLAMGRLKDAMNVKAEFILRPFADSRCICWCLSCSTCWIWCTDSLVLSQEGLRKVVWCMAANEVVFSGNVHFGKPKQAAVLGLPGHSVPGLTAASFSTKCQELWEPCRGLCVHSAVEGSVRGTC